MPETNSGDAVDLAQRARRQGKNATKNAGRAARVAAEPALEEAKEVVNKLEDTAEDAVRTAKRFNPQVMGRITGDVGQAFLALSVAIYGAAIATKKFQGAYAKRGRVLD